MIKNMETANRKNTDRTKCILFKECDKCGMKDPAGNILIPAIYDDIRFIFDVQFKEWPVPVILAGKFGLAAADGKGTLILECKYDYIAYKGGHYLLQKSGQWGVYANGMKHFPINGEWVRQIPKSATIMYMNGLKLGFLDLETGTDTGPIFDNFLQLKKGFPVIVRYNGKDGYIDERGNFTERKEKSWFKV